MTEREAGENRKGRRERKGRKGGERFGRKPEDTFFGVLLCDLCVLCVFAVESISPVSTVILVTVRGGRGAESGDTTGELDWHGGGGDRHARLGDRLRGDGAQPAD